MLSTMNHALEKLAEEQAPSSLSSSLTRPPSASPSPSSSKSRILFGSCNSQYLEQPLWPAIMARNASAFIWAGDAVYSDIKIKGQEIPASPEMLAASYQQQLQEPGYQAFLQQGSSTTTKMATQDNMIVVGTWDDHDFGVNNGDSTYVHKQTSAELFVQFLQASSQRSWKLLAQRASSGKGIYGVIVFDFSRHGSESVLLSDEEAGIDPSVPALDGPLSNKSVAIYLLDVRYNKTPWGQSTETATEGDYQGDFLGEEQWTWLETSLRRSTARVNIVVSGLQVHVERFFNGQLVEEWSRFPAAQHRLYQALLQPNVQAPLLVSGDVHMAEYLRRDCQQQQQQQPPSTTTVTDKNNNINNKRTTMRSLVEVTTSGMTHSWGTRNCPRLDRSKPLPFVCNWYVQGVLRFAMHVSHNCGSWRDLMDMPTSQEGAKAGLQFSLDQNFAEFEFDWAADQLTVRILGATAPHGNGQPPQLSATWDLKNLSTSLEPTGMLSPKDFVHRRDTLSQHMLVQDQDWICLQYRGPVSTALRALAPSLALSIFFVAFLGPIVVPVLVVLWYLVLRRRRRRYKPKQKSTKVVKSD